MALFTISVGSLADRVARLDRVLAMNPACAGAYAWRASAEAEMGDVEGAERSYDACLKLSPGALNCQSSLVELLALGDDCGRLERRRGAPR